MISATTLAAQAQAATRASDVDDQDIDPLEDGTSR